MHDLAAGLLLELERLMLTSTAAGVDLATPLDTAADFQAASGAASMLEAASSRLYNDEVRRGRPVSQTGPPRLPHRPALPHRQRCLYPHLATAIS